MRQISTMALTNVFMIVMAVNQRSSFNRSDLYFAFLISNRY